MLDRITDLSLREVHDAVRSGIIQRHGNPSIPLAVFDTTIDVLIEDGSEVELEDFLQSQWDYPQ